jgi:hypothetical protein
MELLLYWWSLAAILENAFQRARKPLIEWFGDLAPIANAAGFLPMSDTLLFDL